jgi:hypothetical protein
MKMILALLTLTFSTAASAIGCYQIFTSSNALVWQGPRPPVPLDRSAIDDEVKKMVPDGHLVIVDDQSTPCQEVDETPNKNPARLRSRLVSDTPIDPTKSSSP